MARPIVDAGELLPPQRLTPEQARALQDSALLPQEDDGDAALTRVLGQLRDSDSDARVFLYRYNPERIGRGAAKDAYLDEMDPVSFSSFGLRGIQREYGPGQYRIKVHGADGKMLHNSVYAVADLPARLATQSPAAPVQSQGTGEIAQLAASMMEMARQMGESMRAGFQQLAGMVQNGGNKREFLEELQMYKNLFAQPSGQQNQLQTVLETAKLLQDMQPRGGETSTADVFLRLAEQFAPVIAEQMKIGAELQARQPIPVALPKPAVPMRPVTPPVASPSQLQENDVNFIEREFWKQQLNTLIVQAQNDRNPETYAEVVLDNIPDIVSDEKILEFLQKPDVLKELAQADARVSDHAAWFENLRQIMVDMLTMPPEEDQTAGNLTPDPLQE